MSLAIYDAIRSFYGVSGADKMPKGNTGVFFGFSGCTRSACEYAFELMRADLGAWYDVSQAQKTAFFNRVATATANATGADRAGIVKICNWAYVAAKGDKDIYSWFAGADFSTLDYWIKTITDTVSSTASNVAETVEYGLSTETKTEKTIFGTVLPVVGVLGTCYLVKKILD